VYFLGCADGSLSGENPKKLLENIACWIDTVQPQAILTFGPDGVSGHPDHVTLSRIVTQAVEQYFPGICLLYTAPSETTDLASQANFLGVKTSSSLISVDITDFKMKKIQAIQSHASQRRLLAGKPEEEVEKIPCHEYFTVAHTTSPSSDLIDCFET
jgi:LmbE family N-acetylglucosaminyl deacetylase